MGAQFVTREIKTTDKKKIEKFFKDEQAEAAYNFGHSYSGDINMANGLTIENKTFDNEDLAYEYLSSNCQKWENAIAVFYTTQNKETVCLIGAVCSS